MIKDEYSRTAACPCCGRAVHYRTKSEKRGLLNSSEANRDSNGEDCAGCASVLGIGVLA